MKTQLLCTFSSADDLDDTIRRIDAHYDVAYGRVFVLENEDDPDEVFCTYNIVRESRENRNMDSTISVHRKRETNTIYTINALNALILELNGGELDTTYSIPWDDYPDRIILSSEGGVNHIHTGLKDIVDV